MDNKPYRKPSFCEIENTREKISKINYYRQPSFREIEEKRIKIEFKDYQNKLLDVQAY